MPREQRMRLIIAFAALYIIWGSTYLAMRFGIETIPPFVLAGVRFAIAGAILMAASRLKGNPWPTSRQWRAALVIGLLLLLGGNGGVVWSQQFVASSIAALIVGAEPLWVVLLDWARPGGKRPSFIVALGLIIGFAGVSLLIAPSDGHGGVDPLSTAVLMIAVIAWAVGSIYSRSADTPPSPVMATGANMIMGSMGLLGAALISGEFGRFDPGAVSLKSALALVYLIVFGAICGFTAYIWLLRNTSLAAASTYAYVNPVIAVALGWAIGGETVTSRTLLAAGIIVLSVIMITAVPHLRTKYAHKKRAQETRTKDQYA